MDELFSAEEFINSIPGTFGEKLREANERNKKLIEELGEEEYEKRRQERNRMQLEAEEKEIEKKRSEYNIKKSGLEENLTLYRFENFKRDKDYRKLLYDTGQKFINQSDNMFLFIGGQSGSGKTHIGTAVSGYFLSQGIKTIYTTFKLLMQDLKSSLNEEYDETLMKYADIEVLYIDDFMKFKPTQSDIDNSFELINIRVVKNRRTIITSERSLDEILEIDEALGGRIKQKCGEYAINIARKDGRNYRLD